MMGSDQAEEQGGQGHITCSFHEETKPAQGKVRVMQDVQVSG